MTYFIFCTSINFKAHNKKEYIYAMFLTISLDIPRIVLAQITQSMNIHKINLSNTQSADEQMYFLRKLEIRN